MEVAFARLDLLDPPVIFATVIIIHQIFAQLIAKPQQHVVIMEVVEQMGLAYVTQIGKE